MKRDEGELLAAPRTTPAVVVDIGSTQVKIARLDRNGAIESQALHPRDFDAGIARQVESLLERGGISIDSDAIVVCSSANGGLRVGIVCLSPHFSGAALRNQVLLAGANPLFVHTLDEQPGSLEPVDILLVGGGIDDPEAAPLERRLRAFAPHRYRYGSLAYAGNAHVAPLFLELFPEATVIANPLADALSGRALSVFEAVRRAYLDDLVYKEGVSELRGSLAQGIRPTPEIVSQGFQRALANESSIVVSGACIVLDIGGATTDLHYTVEIVRNDSEQKPPAGVSVGRFVFTDLGIVASRDSLVQQLRHHPRLYDFLGRALGSAGSASYQAAREGEWEPTPAVLSCGCVFLALDRFAHGRGPGLPTADLGRIAQVILTGGAAQTLDEAAVVRIFELYRSPANAAPEVLVDRRYQLWVDGITWSGATES